MGIEAGKQLKELISIARHAQEDLHRTKVYGKGNDRYATIVKVEQELRLALEKVEEEFLTISDFADALRYWLPKDEPLNAQTDGPSLLHRAKWHEANSLLILHAKH